MNPRHLSLSAERYTPGYIVEAARKTLGDIDLDPASCEKANQVVGAKRFFTARDNSLDTIWRGRVFLNPPGTCLTNGVDEDGEMFPWFMGCGNETGSGKARKACGCNYVLKFWRKLLTHVDSGDVHAAVWVGFSCSQLQTLQQAPKSPLAFTTCFIKHRVKYLGPDLKPLSSPPHNSYVTLVAPPGSAHFVEGFIESFKDLGDITRKAW